jgi:hypothetical protein
LRVEASRAVTDTRHRYVTKNVSFLPIFYDCLNENKQ